MNAPRSETILGAARLGAWPRPPPDAGEQPAGEAGQRDQNQKQQNERRPTKRRLVVMSAPEAAHNACHAE